LYVSGGQGRKSFVVCHRTFDYSVGDILLDKRLIWNNNKNRSNYLDRVTDSIIVGPVRTVAVTLV